LAGENGGHDEQHAPLMSSRPSQSRSLALDAESLIGWLLATATPTRLDAAIRTAA
jgi:hypothetical protein